MLDVKHLVSGGARVWTRVSPRCSDELGAMEHGRRERQTPSHSMEDRGQQRESTLWGRRKLAHSLSSPPNPQAFLGPALRIPESSQRPRPGRRN